MIAPNHVPVKNTSSRHLMKIFEEKGRLPFDTWTKLQAPGRKKHLPMNVINSLICDISEQSEGGCAIDKGSLSKSVENGIKKLG
jgi:hypothetical protein